MRHRIVARRFKEAVESGEPITGAELVESGGYGASSRLYPGKILRSKGFKAALDELGFSVEAADMVVMDLLKRGRPDIRLAASREVYKRHGAYQDTKDGAPKTLVVNGNGITFKKFNGTNRK